MAIIFGATKAHQIMASRGFTNMEIQLVCSCYRIPVHPERKAPLALTYQRCLRLNCAALCLQKQKYISRFLEVMELNNLLINGIMQTEKALQRIKQVIQRTGLPRSTLYYLMGKGEFPKPVKIAARAVAWDSEKVTAWIESRLSA